jgi:hypothetical protein
MRQQIQLLRPEGGCSVLIFQAFAQLLRCVDAFPRVGRPLVRRVLNQCAKSERGELNGSPRKRSGPEEVILLVDDEQAI